MKELLSEVKMNEYKRDEKRVHPTLYPLVRKIKSGSRQLSWVWNHYKTINVKTAVTNDERRWGDAHASCNACHSLALENTDLKWAINYTDTKSPGHLERHLESFPRRFGLTIIGRLL